MRRNHDKTYDLDRIIFSAVVGMKKSSMIYPVRGGLILEMDRRFTPEQNKIIADKAIKFRNEGVVGLDISGPNVSDFSMKDIQEPVEKAKSYGLGVTIHTGEAQPVEEVWEVVENLQPDRIGHGIKAAQDENLMKELREKNITLEVCPTSNVTLKVVKGWLEIGEIIQSLRDNGVKLTINSDGPVFYGTNVQQEFKKLLEMDVLDMEGVKQMVQNAREATFTRSELFG
jgi:adenosine deaminase